MREGENLTKFLKKLIFPLNKSKYNKKVSYPHKQKKYNKTYVCSSIIYSETPFSKNLYDIGSNHFICNGISNNWFLHNTSFY